MKLQYNLILQLLLVGLHVRDDRLTNAEEILLKREVENVDDTERPNNYDSLENGGKLQAGNMTADCSLIISCMSTNFKNVESEYHHRRMKRCGKLLKSYSKQKHQTGQVTNYERSTDEQMKFSSGSSFYKNESDTRMNLQNGLIGEPQGWKGRANVKLSRDFQLIEPATQDVSTQTIVTETLQRFRKGHSRTGTDRLGATMKNTVFETASISKENRTSRDNHRKTSNTQDDENRDQNTRRSSSVNPTHDQKRTKGIIKNMFTQIKHVMEGGSYKDLSQNNGRRIGDLAHQKETTQTSSGMSKVQLYRTDGWRLTRNKPFLETREKNTTEAAPIRIKVITEKPTKISATTAVHSNVGHPNSRNIQVEISNSHVRNQQLSDSADISTYTNSFGRNYSIFTSKTVPQKLHADTILTGSKSTTVSLMSNFVTQKTKTNEDFDTLAVDQNLTPASTMRTDIRTSDSLIPAGMPDRFSTFQNSPITPFVFEFSKAVTQPTLNTDYTSINSSAFSAVKSEPCVDNQEPVNSPDEDSTQTSISPTTTLAFVEIRDHRTSAALYDQNNSTFVDSPPLSTYDFLKAITPTKFISNNPLHSIATAVKQEPYVSEEFEYEEYTGALKDSTRDSTETSKLPAKTVSEVNESANISERIRPFEDDFPITALLPLFSSVSDYWTITEPTSAADMTSRLAVPKSEPNRVIQEFDNGIMDTLRADSEILTETTITPNDSLESFETASTITHQSMFTIDEVNDTRLTEESRFDLNAQEFPSGHPETRMETSISQMGARRSTATADILMPASSLHQNHTASSILFSSPSIFDFLTTTTPITLVYKTSANSESSSVESALRLSMQESAQNVTSIETLDVSNNFGQTSVSNELFGSSTLDSTYATMEPSLISPTVLTLYLDAEQQEATNNDKNGRTSDSLIGQNHLALTSSAPSQELNALTNEDNSAIGQLDSYSAQKKSNSGVNEHVKEVLRTTLPGIRTLFVSAGDPTASPNSFKIANSVPPENSHSAIELAINDKLEIGKNPNTAEIVSNSFMADQETIFKDLPFSNQQTPNQSSISKKAPITSRQMRDHTPFLTTHRQIPLELETQRLMQTYDSAKRKEHGKEISIRAKESSTATSPEDLVATWSTATPISLTSSVMPREKFIDAVAMTEDIQSSPIVSLPKTTAVCSDFNEEPAHPHGIAKNLLTTHSGRLTSPSSRVKQFDTIVGREKVDEDSLAIESRKSDISDVNPDTQFTATDVFNHPKVEEQTTVQYQSHSLTSSLNSRQNASISRVNATIFGHNPASIGRSMSFTDWWNKTQKVKPGLSSTTPRNTNKHMPFIDWWNSTQKGKPELSSVASRNTNKRCHNIIVIGESNARLLKAILKSLSEEKDDEVDSSSSETVLETEESDLKINRSNKRDLKNQQPFLKTNSPISAKAFDNPEPKPSQMDTDEELLRRYFHFIDPEVFKNFMNVYKQYQPEDNSVRSKSMKTKRSRIVGQRNKIPESDNTITNTLQELVRLRSSIPKALIRPNTPNPQLYSD